MEKAVKSVIGLALCAVNIDNAKFYRHKKNVSIHLNQKNKNRFWLKFVFIIATCEGKTSSRRISCFAAV